jgi:histidinol dehydrogenase
LLAQAEHGSGHERVWLVTTSGKILSAVQREIEKQLPTLARRDFIRRALDNNSFLIQTKTLADALALTNQLAPEHCEVMTRDARKVSQKILTAGAISSATFRQPCWAITLPVLATRCRRAGPERRSRV